MIVLHFQSLKARLFPVDTPAYRTGLANISPHNKTQTWRYLILYLYVCARLRLSSSSYYSLLLCLNIIKLGYIFASVYQLILRAEPRIVPKFVPRMVISKDQGSYFLDSLFF